MNYYLKYLKIFDYYLANLSLDNGMRLFDINEKEKTSKYKAQIMLRNDVISVIQKLIHFSNDIDKMSFEQFKKKYDNERK